MTKNKLLSSLSETEFHRLAPYLETTDLERRQVLVEFDQPRDNAFTLTQEHLSLMLGVRRATVSVIAYDLKRQGLITYKRGKLMVADRDRLEACSCECYRLIREQMARTFSER